MIERIWEMSAQASILIIVVILVRMAIKKLPKVYSYLLWVLVLLRLLCPVFIESSFSMQPVVFAETFGQGGDHGVQMTATNQVQDNISFLNDDMLSGDVQVSTDTQLQQQEQLVVDEQVAVDKEPQGNASLIEDVIPSDAEQIQGKEITASDVTQSGDNQRQENSELSWRVLSDALKVVWLLGALVVAGIFLWQYITVKRKVQTAVRDRENVWLCDRIESPFVMGVFMPRIYLPFGMEEKEKTYVLRHEQTHIRHKDPLVRLLSSIALCLHWWNPLVWPAVFLMNRDMEMFCDETALRGADLEERKAYSAALLRFAVQRSRISVALGFGESNTEKRVRNILNLKKPKLILSIAVVAVILICAICFLTVPKNDGGAGQTETEETGTGEAETGNLDESKEDENGADEFGAGENDKNLPQTMGPGNFVIEASEFEKGAKWVRETGEYDEDTDYYAFVHDFDKDGKEEAFIAIGSLVNAIPTKDSEKMIFGDLWYASGTGKPELLRSNVKVISSQQIISLEDEYILITYYGDGIWNTDMYHVWSREANLCFSAEQYKGVTLKYLKNDELMMTWKATDAVFHELGDSFTGDTTKEYPYAVTGNFYEVVTAEEMSEQDFVKTCGSETVLEQIKTDYKADYLQFLRRENGIWHVNIADDVGYNYEFFCVTFEETEDGLTEVKVEKGYYLMNPLSKERDFCKLVRITREESVLAEAKERFFNTGRWHGRSEESIQKCYDFLIQGDVCEQDKYQVADYYIMFIDDNMEEDYLVMLRQNDWSYEYTARDYEDNGRFLIFMNGERVYSYCDTDYSFTCWYGFTMDFCTDFDNDGYKEMFLESMNGGSGGPDVMVLKYKEGSFERMPVLTRDGSDVIPYVDIRVYAGQEEDEHVIYCADTDESFVVTGNRLSAEEIGRTFEPGEEIGYLGDYHSPDVVDYEGKNALMIKRMIKGEGGNVHSFANACLVFAWDDEGNCNFVDWWLEGDGGIDYSVY